MSLSVFVNGRRISYTGLTYSAVDPGGFESCSFVPQETGTYRHGDEVRVFEGTDTAWHGRIDDPGLDMQFGRISNQINCVGYGADLDRKAYAMVFVDSDASQWKPNPIARQKLLIGLGYGPTEGTVEPSSTGVPGLHLQVQGAWAGTYPVCEAWWDAGYQTSIRRVFWDWSLGSSVDTGNPNWQFNASLNDRDDVTFGSYASVTGMATATSGSGSMSASNPLACRVFTQLYYAVSTAGANGQTYDVWITNLSVFGDHNLPIVVSGTTRGLNLSDIVDEIVKRSGVIFNRNIESNTLLVTQASYKTATAPTEMLADVIKLSGWHWGVWEPSSLNSTPEFIFSRPPSVSRVVGVRDCDTVDVTESLSDIYNEIYLTYTDGFGEERYTTFANPHPRLTSGEVRRLTINGGVLQSAAAEVFARYVLLLTQSDSRVSGSCDLPVQTREGKWAHLLRPGREKLTILGLPQTRSSLGDANSRADTFRIKRISVTDNGEGPPKTQVEFDRGADLIEVLQARITQGNTQIGF
jgi:hypothetical protein